jgi:hypothetical protein
MFAVDDILISDDLLEAPFACDLGQCRGACCVHGDRGAPLEPEERAELDAALPVVWDALRPEARAVIEREGTWVEEAPGEYGTACVGGRECVFVVYEGGGPAKGVAKCALQKAYHAGRLAFEKPISCHLFPIRVEESVGTTVLNYEQRGALPPRRDHGRPPRRPPLRLPPRPAHAAVRRRVVRGSRLPRARAWRRAPASGSGDTR